MIWVKEKNVPCRRLRRGLRAQETERFRGHLGYTGPAGMDGRCTCVRGSV